MNTLITYLNTICPLPENLQDHLQQVLKTGRVDKKKCLVQTGVLCRNIYFIRSGIIRHFHTDTGYEITSCFMKENDIVFSPESFHKQLPSFESIEAIEPTAYYYMSYDDFLYTLGHFPEFGTISWKLTGHYQVQGSLREQLLRIPFTADRFKHMRENYGDIVTRVPNYQLASYLNISAEYLSRLKRNK